MNLYDYKQEYRLFYMVKGHLNTSHATVMQSADSYFRRLWNNNEAYLREEGFEEAFKKVLDNS